jgi:hydroxymethylglutaryl-CoA lyase
MCAQMGIETGVDLSKLLSAAKWIEDKTGRELPSRNLQAAKSKNCFS